jgi:hypothetical protein
MVVRVEGPRAKGMSHRIDAPIEHVVHHENPHWPAPQKSEEGAHAGSGDNSAYDCRDDKTEGQPVKIHNVDFEDGLVAIKIAGISVPAQRPRAFRHK